LAHAAAAATKRARSTESGDETLDAKEIQRLEAYLQKLFKLADIKVMQRPNKDDSAEVYIGEEFVGVLFRDDDDDGLSYSFQMAILEYDLE
jgi:hypothetical protein